MTFNIPGHSTRVLYNAWLGHGGGGGVVVKSFSDDFETGVAGQSHTDAAGGNGGGIWYLQCESEGSPCSFQSTDINSAARYPGQGGMGGAGLVAETRQGTAGVAGAVWLRILAQTDEDEDEGGGNRPPVAETPVDPCKAISDLENVSKKSKSFSGFAANRAVLTKAMKKQIRTWLRKHPKEVCVSVTGFTMGPRVLPTDPKLARDRARAVRSYIKSIRPDASFTKIKFRTEKRFGEKFRGAKVTLRF
jgi:outer membrane protein OmpA-like peptidoglycan-associated protein